MSVFMAARLTFIRKEPGMSPSLSMFPVTVSVLKPSAPLSMKSMTPLFRRFVRVESAVMFQVLVPSTAREAGSIMPVRVVPSARRMLTADSGAACTSPRTSFTLLNTAFKEPLPLASSRRWPSWPTV